MFPEKLQFDNHIYRINKVNEAVQLIYSIDAAFRQLEKVQAPDCGSVYQSVSLI